MASNNTKPAWAKISWVKKLTGWSAEEMRQAREQGLIQWRHNSIDGFQYNLNSIPERLLIKKPENETSPHS